MKYSQTLSAILPAILMGLGTPAAANDSAAAVALGGLVLTHNESISMDEEDLFISQQEVRVRYRFTNHSARDIATLVSFPVPDVPQGINATPGDQAMPDFRKLGFVTTVDGQPVKLDYSERAQAGGHDVTARLNALGWPLRWFADYPDSASFIDRLSPAQQAAFQREGLLHRGNWQGAPLQPAWNLVTHVTRRQTFPAGRSIVVTHRYVPLAGGSVGGNLDKRARNEAFFEGHSRTYCIDDDFLAAFDRRQSRVDNGQPSPAYMEHWLSYILKSGSNWRGPIGSFHLVVDKGASGNLVSFCMEGVKKISPTRFEVVKRNFEPRRDLDILIAEWLKPE